MACSFEIIYADPAWNYKDKCHSGKRGAGYKYQVTDTDSICKLPVSGISSPNSCLFLWSTMPMIPDALRVIEAWGFKYKTVAFVWIKQNRVSDTDFFGMGNWTRANAELCLIGTKGSPKRISASVRQVIRRPIMKHSEKPPEVRDSIVELLGDIPRIELFARQKIKGWSSWGNEIESDIELTT